MIDYEELRIRAFKTGTDRYLMLANGSEAAAAVITLKKSAAEYRRELQDLLREEFAGQPDRPCKASTAVKRLGRELFEIILPAPIHDCVLASLQWAQKHDRHLRVRFDVAPELMDIPFELLCSPAFDPLGAAALRPAISLARSLRGLPLSAQRTPQAEDPRAWFPLLVLAPAPAGRKALNVRGELKKIRAELPPFVRVNVLHVLSGPDPGSLRSTKKRVSELLKAHGGKPCAILVIAHGEYRQGEIVVALERENGQPDLIPAQILADLLAQAEGLRLVILNLCLSSQGIFGEPFSGLAQALIAGGIPAVVAMQAEVSDDAAKGFSPTLLGALWQNQTVDEAVSRARQAVASALSTQSEWGSPVLFLHQSCSQGWLFKVPGVQDAQDPLAEERALLERLNTAPCLDDIALDAHFLRGRRKWSQVAEVANYLVIQRPQEAERYRRLVVEAQTELRIDEVEAICDALAREGEDPTLGAQVVVLLNALPSQVLDALSREVEQAGEALQHYDEAARAVQREAWAEVRERCEAILLLRPGGYRDVQELLQRADLELTLEAEARARAAYERGCEAEERGLWAEAAAAFAEVPETWREDVVPRRSHAERRIAEAQLLEALPWAEDLAAAGLAADPCAGASGLQPYAALREAGIHPGSSAAAIKDASFTLMKKGALTPEARLAWDELRSPEGRLRVDASLYRLEDPEALRRSLRKLPLESHPDLVVALGQASPGDAPLFLLLDGRRDKAIAAWEQLLAEDPSRTAAAHGLALACTFGAREAAETLWEKAIAAWVVVLGDDAFWEAWRRERTDLYPQPVTPADVARLRSELGQEFLDHPAGGADEERSRALALALEIELEGARLLHEVGGLPLDESGGRRLVCGPLYLRQRDLGARLAAKIAELEAADNGREREHILTPLDAALGGDIAGIAPGTLFRLRCAFSGLGRPLLLLDQCQPELTLSALPPLHPARPAEHQDAVELAVRAHLALARNALASGERGLLAAFKHWREAIEVSRSSSSQVRTKRAVARVVLGRARVLAQERGQRRGERLTAAIELLDRARPLIGGADEGQLTELAAQVLADRGVWYGSGCSEWEDFDYEKAAQDLRRAVELTPDNVHALDNLSRALIFQAANLQGEPERRGPLKLLAEAIAVLHEGLCRTASHGQLIYMLRQGLDELENYVLFELDEDDLAQRIAKLDTSRPAAGESDAEGARQMVATAELRRAQGDETGELLALITAVRSDTGNSAVRRSLLEAVRRRAAS